jgi:hypothetical protein
MQAFSRVAVAQAYPTRPITMIVPMSERYRRTQPFAHQHIALVRVSI